MFLRGFLPLPCAAYRPHKIAKIAFHALSYGKWFVPVCIDLIHPVPNCLFHLFSESSRCKISYLGKIWPKNSPKVTLISVSVPKEIKFYLNSKMYNFRNFEKVQRLDSEELSRPSTRVASVILGKN